MQEITGKDRTGRTMPDAGNAPTDAAGTIRAALIGAGIGASRTPAMHMAEGRAQGLAYHYDLIDTAGRPGADIGALLAEAEAVGCRGVNVTHPFKQAALAHLDSLSPAAEAVGAVNTVVFEDGRRHGHNTDCWGFAEAFARELAEAPREVVLLLGAGGAGGAVAEALMAQGVGLLLIRDSRQEAAETLAQRLAARHGAARVEAVSPGTEALAAAAQRACGLVNATPIGMASHPGLPLPAALIRPRHWVADIVYFPLETELLATARARGCRVMSGAGMAVFQAVRAFELFTGRKADPDRMRAAFEAAGSRQTAGTSGTLSAPREDR